MSRSDGEQMLTDAADHLAVDEGAAPARCFISSLMPQSWRTMLDVEVLVALEDHARVVVEAALRQDGKCAAPQQPVQAAQGRIAQARYLVA